VRDLTIDGLQIDENHAVCAARQQRRNGETHALSRAGNNNSFQSPLL
jgi:hypothetical protein